MTFKNELDRAGPVVDRLNAAIRDNPLAAGLVGAGIAWMLMGGSKGLGVAAGATKSAAGVAGSAAATAGSALANGIAKAGSTTAAGLKRAASQVAESTRSLVPDMEIPDTQGVVGIVTDTGTAVIDRFNSATVTGRECGVALQSRLSESLDKQPLLLGAIGLAIGAGIASSFATSAIERELMGEQGSSTRERLQAMAGDVAERAKHVVSDLTDEAVRQGVTVDAAKGAAAKISEKVKTVASAGGASVAQHFKATSG